MQCLKQGSFRSSLLMFLATMADIYSEESYSQYYRSLKWPGYSRASVGGMVRRMISMGELVLGKEGLVMGIKGKELVEEFVPVRKYRLGKWDGVWRVVAYAIGDSSKLKRNQLRLLLTKYGFGLWQKSVYLTPHPVIPSLSNWLKVKGLLNQVILMDSRKTAGIENKALAGIIFKSNDRLKAWELLVGDGYRVMREGRGVVSWVNRYENLITKEPWLPGDLELAQIPISRRKAAIIMQKIVE